MERLWPYISWPVAISYLWWALVWGLVAYYYLTAGAAQWGRLHHSGRSRIALLGLGLWVTCVTPLTRLLQGRFTQITDDHQRILPRALMLQIGICASALCSVSFGLMSFFVDRSDYSITRVLIAQSAVVISTVGGMIHLYAPMRDRRIVLWRLMVLTSWLVLPSACLIATAAAPSP